jgi:type I restriction enzyme S subunit
MDGLMPYPALKATNDLHIGDIPDHWNILPLCAIAKPKAISNQCGRELLSVYLNHGVVPFRSVKEKRTNATSEDLSNYQAVDPGDFVLNNQQAWRGSVGVSMHQGIVSPAYLVLSLGPRINPKYANLLFRERSMVAQYLIASKGVGSIQRNLYWPHLKRIPIILPPLPEQAAIVRFLDHANRKIRRYIRAKQKLIKLLEEQKQVIIHRAVTRGLDPNVCLKASGVEWLGDVPEHWTLYRPKLLFRQVTLPKPANAEMVTCFRDGQVTLRRNRRTEGFTNAIKELGYQGIRAGQLVLHSMDAFAGAIGVSDSEGKCSPEYVICEPSSSGICVKYYALLLRSLALRGLFVVLCPSVRERAPRVRFSDFGSFELPKPPLREQEQVVDAIEAECSEVERSLQAERRSVYLVGEYRIRLIADVVTGKLDVRDAAAQLPDEDQELPAIDELEDISDSEEDAPDDLEEAPEDPES